MLQLNDRSGNKRPLWLVDSEYRIGAGAECELKLDVPGLANHEASLTIAGDTVSLATKNTNSLIKVNGESVKGIVPLAHGDAIQVGGLIFDLIDPKQRKVEPVVKVSTNTHLWRLQPLNSALSSREFAIETTAVLGRSKECDITLGVSHLSRRHAELRVTPAGLEVIDLNSSNGTYVNGSKVSKAVLKAGDELSFDTLRFQVVSPASEAVGKSSQEDDLDKTTMRPAISNEELSKSLDGGKKPAGQDSAAPVKRAVDKPLKKVSPTEAVASQSSEESSSNGKYLIIAAALAVAVAGAWFMLKG